MYKERQTFALCFIFATTIAQDPFIITPAVQPGVPTFTPFPNSICNADTEYQCGFASANVQCERSCNDTQLCLNVCVGGQVGNIVGGQTRQCVCKEGLYRSKQGLCVSFDVCQRENINTDPFFTVPTAQPGVPTLTPFPNSICNADTENQCSLVSANLQCEKSCNDTQLCVNVCAGGVVGNIVGGQTRQCVCKEGFYRNKQGLCVSFDVCLRESINAVCTGANERQVDCSVLDVNLKCEKKCNSTQVCTNVCTSLLSGTLNGVNGLLGALLNPAGGAVGGIFPPIAGSTSGLSFQIGALNGCACQEGFFRDHNGLCVSLDVCTNGNISG
uniref:EGF-like domain-containing protein n=1 Tax=Plectus sambesii TaxID=2011161 RepID=A0A914WMG0_9BILA